MSWESFTVLTITLKTQFVCLSFRCFSSLSSLSMQASLCSTIGCLETFLSSLAVGASVTPDVLDQGLRPPGVQPLLFSLFVAHVHGVLVSLSLHVFVAPLRENGVWDLLMYLRDQSSSRFQRGEQFVWLGAVWEHLKRLHILCIYLQSMSTFCHPDCPYYNQSVRSTQRLCISVHLLFILTLPPLFTQ